MQFVILFAKYVAMDVSYSLMAAVLITFVLIFVKFAIISWIRSWVTWFRNIMHLRSLPSPPRRWLVGHALEVRRKIAHI